MKLTDEQINRACDLAKAATPKMKVRIESFGTYKVFSPASFRLYTVRFWKVGTEKHGSCNCAAGAMNQVCKHCGSVIGLHVVLAEERQQASVTNIKDYQRRAAA